MEKKQVLIYTDGGCAPNPGLGGWGAVLISVDSGKEKELSGFELQSTNNRMELMAAIMALAELKRSCIVTLRTDSSYLKKAFTDGWLVNWQRNNWKTASKQPVKNKDLWERLLELTKTHAVTWEWVKGHSTSRYNNRCDELVHEARSRSRLNPVGQ